MTKCHHRNWEIKLEILENGWLFRQCFVNHITLNTNNMCSCHYEVRVFMGFPGVTSGKRTCLPRQAIQEIWVHSLGCKDPLEKEMATHSNILTGESHGQRRLAGYSSLSRRVRHDSSDSARTRKRGSERGKNSSRVWLKWWTINDN